MVERGMKGLAISVAGKTLSLAISTPVLKLGGCQHASRQTVGPRLEGSNQNRAVSGHFSRSGSVRVFATSFASLKLVLILA